MTDVDNTLENTPLLSDLTYNRLRTFVQLIMPALATLYFTLATILGLPAPEQVVAALAALATFGGVILRASRNSYDAADTRFDGQMNVSQDASGSKMFSLELKGDPAELSDKKEIVFKVNEVNAGQINPPQF